MTRAEMETRCREIVARIIEQGRRGELDALVHGAIVERLSARLPRHARLGREPDKT